jgi:hypothetical protein
LLTAGLTVFGGAVVLVAGQIIQRFYLEPIQEQRKTIGEIAYALNYDANVTRKTIADESAEEAERRLRALASSLRATMRTTPSYRFFVRLGWVPPESNIIGASRELIGWSNRIGSSEWEVIHKRRVRIAWELGIKIES